MQKQIRHLQSILGGLFFEIFWPLFKSYLNISKLIFFLGQYGQGPLDDNAANNKDELNQKDAVFYATFSTAPNAIGGSAVCAFRLRTVSDAFAGKKEI